MTSVAILDIAEGPDPGSERSVNPDKLRRLGPVGDLGALLRGRSQQEER